MAVGYGVACPKPAKGAARRRLRLDRKALAKRMRDQVWKRVMAQSSDGYAYCEQCQRGPLKRTLAVLDANAGHVAHERGRNVAPEDKYNPDKAHLYCRDCHLGGDHGMRFC